MTMQKTNRKGVKSKMEAIKKYKKTGTRVAGYAVKYFVLCCFSYVLIYPFLYMIINALKTPTDWFDPTVTWLPKGITLDGLRAAVKFLQYGSALFSTLLNEIAAALISFFTCAVAGYGLARFKFKGKSILTGIMILCIIIPDPLIMVPSYSNFRHMDLLGILNKLGDLVGYELRPSIVDTPLVFWLPALFSTGLKSGLFIYIYRQFFKGFPKELEEAAWIDGAGPWKTFTRIVLPSSGSARITVLVFAVVWYWNDYYQAQIYLSQNYPLSVVLANFSQNMVTVKQLMENYSFTTGSLMISCCLLSVLPLIVFFLIVQRRFLQSIATSGIVG